MPSNWVWLEVPLAELGEFTDFNSLTERFRGPKPVGLVTPLVNLNGYAVINLLAPKNSAFWTVGRFSSTFRFHNHLSTSIGVGNATLKKQLFKDFRIGKVSKEKPSIRLFDIYSEVLRIQTRAIPGLSQDGVSTPERFRLISTGVVTSSLNNLVAFFDAEVEQFGGYSFFTIDESVVFGPPFAHDMPSIGAYLFSRFAPFMDFGDEWRAYMKREIHGQLKWVVSRMESGIPFDIPIEPYFIIRPPLSFSLFDTPRENELVDQVHREIRSYRARLIRLLGWPMFYDDVVEVFNPESAGYVGNYGITHPYDLIGELQAYLQEMRQKYPILDASPFPDAST